MKVTKKMLAAYVKHKLATDEGWAQRALLVIYSRQEMSERVSKTTTMDNGRGFTGFDAPFLRGLAAQLKEKHWLSAKQMAKLYNRMPHYWEQIIEVAASDDAKYRNLQTQAREYAQAQARAAQGTLIDAARQLGRQASLAVEHAISDAEGAAAMMTPTGATA